jgi:hypothetical protein
MRQVQLRDVPLGEYFRLKSGDSGPVWVRGAYAPGWKKFMCHKFDDINHESLKKGDTLVWVGFDF